MSDLFRDTISLGSKQRLLEADELKEAIRRCVIVTKALEQEVFV
jgi:hypothetical protein